MLKFINKFQPVSRCVNFCCAFIKVLKQRSFLFFPPRVIFFLIAASVLAETVSAESGGDLYIMDTMVVSAKKDEAFQTGDVDLEQTSAFYSLINREDFEGKMEDLAEVIEKEVGVQVRQSGGLGSFSTVSLRGSSSEQVMVYLDGILLNDASGGGVDLSNISLADVESIEIYRGITPVNFGKASVGGVVNIKTLRAEKGFSASACAGYGSFDTRKYSGFINHKPGRWDYLISAGYLGSDNDFEMLNDNGTEWNKDDDQWEDRNNAKFDQNNVLTKAGFDFTDDVRIDVINQWYSKDQRLPAWNNSDKVKTSFDTKRNISTIKFTADDIGPYHFNTSTRIEYSWKEEEYDDRYGRIGLGKQHNRYTTERFGGNFFVEWMTANNILSMMLDLQHEEYDPDDLLEKQNTTESKRDTFNAGLQDSVVLFNERFIITPAIRYTTVKDELKSAISIWGMPLEGRSRNEDYFCPQIGAKYRIFDWLTIKSNIAKYVREPSFFELFGDRGFFVGNMDLKAEKGVNFDAGFEIDWITQNDWLKRVVINVSYFKSDVDDLITRVYDSRGIGKSDNISEARIDGFEAGINMDILKYFSLICNATWQDAENRNEIPLFNGKDLPGKFDQSYMGRVEANYKGVKIYYESIVEKGMYYDTANLLEAEDKKEMNIGVSWLFRSVLFSFEAKNIEDNHYEDFNGYPLPGESYFFSIKYSL